MTGAGLTLERKAPDKSEKPIQVDSLDALAELADGNFVSLALPEDTPPVEGILFKSSAHNTYILLQKSRGIICQHIIKPNSYKYRAITRGTPDYDVNKKMLVDAGRWHSSGGAY
jgi:hypothetical protein